MNENEEFQEPLDPELFPNELVDESDGWEFALINKMKRDALDKIGFDPANMKKEETRFLVTSYYAIQKARLQLEGRKRALDALDSSTSMVKFIHSGLSNSESNIKKMLGIYSASQPIGRWAESIPGVGPVISSALISHIDIEKAPTVGRIWRFAGLDPTSEWLGREKATALVNSVIPQRSTSTEATDEQIAEIATKANRQADRLRQQALGYAPEDKPVVTKSLLIKVLSRRPYNADLKLVCWKLGNSFVPIADKPSKTKGPDIYGKIYKDRKVLEIQRNESGLNADLADDKKGTVDRSTDAYAAYSMGMLPKGQIHQRACRYAAKFFLSHWHHVRYEMEYGTLPPKPFVIEHLGHQEYIKPPHWVDGEVVCDCHQR